MLSIDGSQGEGGGQILRSSLAMSMVTGTPFQIQNIRGKRRKPGLMRQHLTAVRAAQEVCNATIEGDAIGSMSVTFKPGTIAAGDYHFRIGTAGSTNLVLQTVLPALMVAKQPSNVLLEGGTHNPFAPPFDFLAKAFLPAIEKLGVQTTIELERPGFYPAGGGRLKVAVMPTESLKKIAITTRGEIKRRLATATVANLPVEIAEREIKVIRKKLNWPEESLRVVEVKDTPGPGNIVTIEVESDACCEVFTGFGEVNRPASAVANQAVQQCKHYLASAAPVGDFLADQLMLPMAIAGGGEFHTTRLTRHAITHIDMIHLFMDCRITTEQVDRGNIRVVIE